MEPTRYLTKREAADRLRVSSHTIERYVRSGVLPQRKLGRLCRFLEVDVMSLLKEPTCHELLERPGRFHPRADLPQPAQPAADPQAPGDGPDPPEAPAGPRARAYQERKGEHVLDEPGRIEVTFSNAVRRAGLSDDVTPHTPRHTRATHLAIRGVSMRDIADLLGDTEATVAKHYRHLSPAHLRAALEEVRLLVLKPKMVQILSGVVGWCRSQALETGIETAIRQTP